MKHPDSGGEWQVKLIGPRLPWGTRALRPAEVGDHLRSLMLAPENLIEDAQYNKIVPNHYIVEINESHYARYYQPIADQVVDQWQVKMLEHLNTANSRQGRRAYRLAGPLKLAIRPAADLPATQARVLSRFLPDQGEQPAAETLLACLELLPGGRRWQLRPGTVTLGRNESCDITLNLREVQQKRLVSGLHAYILWEEGQFRIFDGAPGGRPSLNGTYVNNQPVPAEGRLLQDGDTIILAAIDPARPRADTPGTATLRFHLECR